MTDWRGPHRGMQGAHGGTFYLLFWEKMGLPLAPSGPSEITNGWGLGKSTQYKATDTIKASTIVFFTGELIPCVSNYFLFLNGLLDFPVFVFISVLHLLSFIIHAPIYLNLFTCSTACLCIYQYLQPFIILLYFHHFLFLHITFYIFAKKGSPIFVKTRNITIPRGIVWRTSFYTLHWSYAPSL